MTDRILLAFFRQRCSPANKFLTRAGWNSRIDYVARSARSVGVFGIRPGKREKHIRFEKQRQVGLLLSRTITRCVNYSSIVAPLQVRETKTPARVGGDLVGDAAAESFQPYEDSFGRLVGVCDIYLA